MDWTKHRLHDAWLWIEDAYLRITGQNRMSYGVKRMFHTYNPYLPYLQTYLPLTLNE